MLVSLISAALSLSWIAQDATPIERDTYGVPHIYSSSLEEAFFYAGFACAEDRLWQMEMSRRLARGSLAEVLGASRAAADQTAAASRYTDEELKEQFDQLSQRAQTIFESYAKGVNAYIRLARSSDTLPPDYGANGFEPAPWTVEDSAAIAIRLFQMFGRRDPGELRALALLTYLKTQPVKDQLPDVLDDFLWQNEPTSPTTVQAEDDPLAKDPPKLFSFTRKDTERHLAALPNVSLLELLPAVLAQDERELLAVAQELAVPYKTGSYAVAVAPKRSATRSPLLLSGPQMGFQTPSIVHEMSISAPGYMAAGMDVPGVPGIAVGHSPSAAWGLTTGVADTDDIFYFESPQTGKYLFEGEERAIEEVPMPIKVKDQPDLSTVQKRTMWGPVVLESRSTKTVFCRRSASWMKELLSVDAMLAAASAKKPEDLDSLVESATVNFNLIAAFATGDISYRYVGYVPVRKPGWDSRLPLPASRATDWSGRLQATQMPRVDNPASGLIVNWNNKPIAWWPNGDTPAWGRLFRVSALQRRLSAPSLSVSDLELAVFMIAREDPDWTELAKLILPALREAAYLGTLSDAANYLQSWNGLTISGSQGASLYSALLDALRPAIVSPKAGRFMTPDLMRLAAQPSVLLKALERSTRVDYLGEKSGNEIVREAFEKVVQTLSTQRGPDPGLWGFRPGGIALRTEPPIPYGNRGTFLQIVEVRNRPVGRSVLPPGNAESGEHSSDQIPLARAWTYKPMRIRPAQAGGSPAGGR